MCLLFAACSVIFPVKTSTEERIQGFSAKNTALREPVEVRWNAYLVPFVTANNNHDLAYTLGMLHGHLRASQVQLLKRVAYARLSELGGPYTNEVDHLLKLLDFPRAAEAVYRNMPEATRNWVDAFAAGFNHQVLTNQHSR